jgi:hypothetical protein
MAAFLPAIASVAAPFISKIFGGGGGGQDEFNQIPTKSKGQQKQQNTALKQWQDLAGGGYEDAIGLLESLLDPDSETYKGFAQPYLDQFHQQTLPGIAEQYASYGSGLGGGLASSGFAQSLGSAGANLTSQLASLRENLRMQGAKGLLGQYNTMFGQTQGQESFGHVPREQGFLESMLPGATKGVFNAFTNSLVNRSGGGGQDVGRGYQSINPLMGQLDTMFRSGQIR